MRTDWTAPAAMNFDGTVPANNPWSDGDDWQKYVFAYGLRDPAKFAVNASNGIIYINDPGAEKFEEINIGKAGGHWCVREKKSPGPKPRGVRNGM